jgi:O-antigen/teichoic acid export membrane protein
MNDSGKKTTGILLAVAGIFVCIISSTCGSLVLLLGQGRTEPAPVLIVLFIIALLVNILSPILIIAGVVFIATSAGRKATPPMGPKKLCPACGTENPPDYGFCERCGGKLN